MAPDDVSAPGPRPAASPVRALSRRYLLVLIAVAALVVIDQAIIQPMLVGLSFYAPKINLAGRQRMLSQKVSKEALALAQTTDADLQEQRRRQLIEAVQQWTAAHRELSGALAPSSRSDAIDPIETALLDLDASLTAISTAATTIAAPNTSPAERLRRLEVVLKYEPRFLAGMERVVGMYEAAAEREVMMLRLCGLAVMATILVLLGGVYFVVLRPATTLIRDQVGQLTASEFEHRQLAAELGRARDELEHRVQERTSELQIANTELARESAERQTAEQRQRDLASQLAHASRITALGQLGTGLAHEINQPLASIVSYADTAELRLEQEPPELTLAREAIGQVKQAAMRAGAIVRRMRNFVRRGTPSVVRVDLNDLVREVCELCRPRLDQAGVQFALETSAEPVVIEADAIEIQQVLVNLVQNAVQALGDCPRARRRLRVHSFVEFSDVCVEVVDSGAGFPIDTIENSFAPFYSTKADGLGMGLAISRTILERYKGRLWAENHPAGGARVVIALPLVVENDEPSSAASLCLCR